VFEIGDVLVCASDSGLVVTAVLAPWPWARRRAQFAIAGASAVFGIAARNLVISHAEAPIIRLSWQDVGSGVLAFAATAPVLGSSPIPWSRPDGSSGRPRSPDWL